VNFKSLTAPGIKAVKDNWRAIVLIQICFLAFVILFYTVPAMYSLPDRVTSYRATVGPLIFVVGSIWFVSIVVPEIAKLVTKSKSERLTWKDLVLRMIYFAVIGISIDLLYSWMGTNYGSTATLTVVAKKVLTDMLLYTPLFSMPLAVITFLFKDRDYSASGTVDGLKHGEFPKRFLPLLVTCWMYFGPVTIAMYSLPVVLNFPLAMASQAAWGIIVVAVGSHQSPELTP
jgi:hypothetical protein